MHYLTGHFIISGEIAWQYFPSSTQGSDNSVRVGFHLSGEYSRREALKIVEDYVTRSKVRWISLTKKDWIFDLDKLHDDIKNYKQLGWMRPVVKINQEINTEDIETEDIEALRLLAWMTGKLRIAPDIETKNREAFGKMQQQTSVAFYIEPIALEAASMGENMTQPIELDERLNGSLPFDVVISFAGEDRAVAILINEELKKARIKTFYDEDHLSDLWGKNLAEYLDHVYSKAGKFCLMIISKAYLSKIWTRHERRAAISRMIREKSEYVLPYIIDETRLTDLPGLNADTCFITSKQKPPIEMAAIIIQKLALPHDLNIETIVTAENEAAWEGIQVGGVFYAWSGSLLSLEDREPVAPPAGLLKEIERLGLKPRWATMNRLAYHVERGLAQVFATDRKIWRRPVIDRNHPLMVGKVEQAK